MIDPNGVFGQFVLAVAYLRQLQQIPLSQFSAANAHELQRVTDEVDSELAMLLTRSVMADQFAAVIDAHHAGAN